MAKRLTEKQKKEIIELFKLGENIEVLSQKFCCTKLTISRNLKKNIGEKKYNKLLKNSQAANKVNDFKNNSKIEDTNNIQKASNSLEHSDEIMQYENSDETFLATPFLEITPLNYEITDDNQKDLSSIPISEIKFPKVVFMIVDKKIELQTKLLKEYPDWQFLPKHELNRKTIEIFEDSKSANRYCNKEQKVLKVPNTEVFKIVAPILISRGISRIVSSDKLIAL